MAPVITLTTDFGMEDAYVASMKGAILSIDAGLNIIDITHQISPQNIRQAAFLLHNTHSAFPAGTVHLVVVDPGVGSERRAVVLKTPAACFVAPDNGVLSYIIEEYCPGIVISGSVLDNRTKSYTIRPPLSAVALTQQEYWRNPVSPVFHGRDVFAPVAAYLATGIPPERFGERIDELQALSIPRPVHNPDGSIAGCVIHIDTFGNLVTNIRRSHFPSGNTVLCVGDRQIRGIQRYYAELEGLGVVEDSSGYLEISLKNGSAQASLDATIGTTVKMIIPGDG